MPPPPGLCCGFYTASQMDFLCLRAEGEVTAPEDPRLTVRGDHMLLAFHITMCINQLVLTWRPGPSNCISAHWTCLSSWQNDNTRFLYGVCVYIVCSLKRQPNKLVWLFYQGENFSCLVDMNIYLVLSEYQPWCGTWSCLSPELMLFCAHLVLGVCWCVHVESCAMVS